MALLEWRLTLFALALLPFSLVLTRRVGTSGEKGRSRDDAGGTLADISSLVQEIVWSVYGILLGKTMAAKRPSWRTVRLGFAAARGAGGDGSGMAGRG